MCSILSQCIRHECDYQNPKYNNTVSLQYLWNMVPLHFFQVLNLPFFSIQHLDCVKTRKLHANTCMYACFLFHFLSLPLRYLSFSQAAISSRVHLHESGFSHVYSYGKKGFSWLVGLLCKEPRDKLDFDRCYINNKAKIIYSFKHEM